MMARLPSGLLGPLALLLILSGCGREDGAGEQALEPDPAIVAALAEPLMTDPDLAAQNQGNAAIVIGAFDGVPAWTREPNEIASARERAVRLAGGALLSAPAAEARNERVPHPAPRQLAAALPGLPPGCMGQLREGHGWAADMPKATSIYPGGHVEQAAGARGGCTLRAIRYVTAAEPRDVFDFHYTMLAQAGFRVERDGSVLMARKGRSSARIGVADMAGGMTQVTLASAI